MFIDLKKINLCLQIALRTKGENVHLKRAISPQTPHCNDHQAYKRYSFINKPFEMVAGVPLAWVLAFQAMKAAVLAAATTPTDVATEKIQTQKR